MNPRMESFMSRSQTAAGSTKAYPTGSTIAAIRKRDRARQYLMLYFPIPGENDKEIKGVKKLETSESLIILQQKYIITRGPS